MTSGGSLPRWKARTRSRMATSLLRGTLVLAEVLGPRVDEEDLDQRRRIFGVLVERPADRAVAATQALDVAHGGGKRATDRR